MKSLVVLLFLVFSVGYVQAESCEVKASTEMGKIVKVDGEVFIGLDLESFNSIRDEAVEKNRLLKDTQETLKSARALIERQSKTIEDYKALLNEALN